MSALGLMVFVIFGTWACLTASTDGPGTSTVVALVGAVTMVVGVVARGDGSSAVAKARRVIAGVGLVVAPVTGVLTLLALGTDPTTASRFLLVTLAALAAWAQGIAAQAGLSLRVSFTWLVAMAMTGVVAIVMIGVVVTSPRRWARLICRRGTAVLIAFADAPDVRRSSSSDCDEDDRPDRQAVGGAVGRAALGRPAPSDLEVLAAGPGALFRRRPTAGS